MAKDKKGASEKKTSNQPNALVQYVRETRGEIRKVTWPTRDESMRLTGIVLAVTLAFAAFLWLFDTLFSNALNLLISQIVGA